MKHTGTLLLSALLIVCSNDAWAQVQIERFDDACTSAFEKDAPKTVETLAAIKNKCLCLQPAIRLINGRIAGGVSGTEEPLMRELLDGDFLIAIKKLQAATDPGVGRFIARCLDR